MATWLVDLHDNCIKIADINGEVKLTLTGHSGFIWSMIVLPNGDLASASGDKTIKIWSA
jgi:phospholipase A-2-activating protein